MTLEERVAALEQEVSELKKAFSEKKVEQNWRKTFGLSGAEPSSDEAYRLGHPVLQLATQFRCVLRF